MSEQQFETILAVLADKIKRQDEIIKGQAENIKLLIRKLDEAEKYKKKGA